MESMSKVFFMALAWGMLCSCTSKSSLNQLSAAEEKEGWELLFDGKTMDKFRGYCKDNIPKAWSVSEDGAIHLAGAGKQEAGTTNGGDIISKENYGNFELSLEWKVSKGGNSGIFYLAKEACGHDTIPAEPIWKNAPEMQVIDNIDHPAVKDGTLHDSQLSGSLYDMITANPQNAKPAGEWNQVKITVSKGTVEHWMNGEKVVEYHLWTDEWKSMVAKSKFAANPDFVNLAHEGHIGLQDHGDEVWYRNIKIRKLN